MKKVKLIGMLLVIASLTLNSIAQTTAIPDANFEQALINLGYDTGSPDGFVLTANIDTISILDVSFKNISSLSGIEEFTNLKELHCYYNQLTLLDVTQNLNLNSLYCSYNQLSSLNVSQNTGLNILSCEGNLLTSLDVSQNIQLTILSDSLNSIAEHDFSNNINLTRYGGSQNGMTCLNLKNGNNTNMIHLSVNQNLLSCIEVDNPSWANSNWTVLNNNIDNGVSFSLNCNNSCSTVGIKKLNQFPEITISPNPTRSTVNISLEESANIKVTIRNSLGQSIMQDAFKNSTAVRLDLDIPAGLYFLEIEANGNKVTKKLIKQ
ncbi:MAG: T9SS type A sorting domain-containing protein [Flavobacteriales bacterium]|nr:T9SS type A sorting domain-containing protein [Flavobacteriales bacterium]MCB9363166.1 T9SS type A sorting domain-containing protein [Flavobacteriales bacterium]